MIEKEYFIYKKMISYKNQNKTLIIKKQQTLNRVHNC